MGSQDGSKMLQIECSGTPYQIGYKHGSVAALQIERCIAFYADMFVKTSKRDWEQVKDTAREFEHEIKEKWPRYYEELQGVAEGSKRDLLDIIAINVRTEIAFGLFSDGCTSLYWKTPSNTFLGQNWDWNQPQKENLIVLTIHQPSLPTIKMVTEAGLIGKIGINSAGVGVCFNAIRATGITPTNLPVHLGLRLALESKTAKDAVEAIEKVGMGATGHFLIGDANNATGLEFTSKTFARLPVNESGMVVHSNHFLAEHKGVDKIDWLKDSPVRIEQMNSLTGKVGTDPGFEDFEALFVDQSGFPASICRAQEGESSFATLFNICMDLKAKRAVVKLGRPCAPEEVIEFTFP